MSQLILVLAVLLVLDDSAMLVLLGRCLGLLQSDLLQHTDQQFVDVITQRRGRLDELAVIRRGDRRALCRFNENKFEISSRDQGSQTFT